MDKMIVRRGWIKFDWGRICGLGMEPVNLGGGWLGAVYECDGTYYGEAFHKTADDKIEDRQTDEFPTAQAAGDDMLAQVRATFPE